MLELDDVGRLALAVLDGGLFAGSRVVELAAAYLEAGHEANEAMQVDDKTGEVGS